MLKPFKSRRPLIAAIMLSASVGAIAGAAVALPSTPESANALVRTDEPVDARSAPAARAANSPARPELADMVQAVGPAVVQIDVRPETGARDSFGGWGERSAAPARASTGSGFVIDPAGIVVTNNHVVDGATTVTVKFSDGRERTGRVLGRDPKTDLAVIRVDGGGRFAAIRWGDSDRARVGDDVFAVGSPFGLGNTVTSGIVSARGREIGAGPYDDFLQVDAAINSGNSGGPLFNAAGQVVGVNTALFSPTGGNVGIGFAIPSRLARSIVRQIVTEGHVSRGRIGVALAALTPEIAQQLELGRTAGALVADVEPGSPAAEAGLRSGDVVTAFAGRPIADSRTLARVVAEHKVGTSVPLTVIRAGRPAQVRVRVAQAREG